MKPVHHLLFGFVVTMGFFLLFLPDQITWPIVFLATVSGFLPDFDHREWIWKLIAGALFAGFFLFFGNSLLTQFQGDELVAGVAALAAAGVISYAVYAAHPFKGTIMDLNENRLQFWGAEGWFLALYVLVVYAVTLSPVIALAALIAYSSHWVLDRIAYYTYFGRKNLVNYPHPEFGPKWQIRRQQQEELAKHSKAKSQADKPEKEEKKEKEKHGKHGKPTAKHAFLFVPGVTETDRQGEGEHGLASDEQVMAEPELQEEETHGETGAGH